MYADIIIDITHEKLDKVFQYRIPSELKGILKLEQKSLCPLEEEIKRPAVMSSAFRKLRIMMQIRSSLFCVGQKIKGQLSRNLWRLLRG